MAHYAKYTKASCGQMLSHYDREKENIGNKDLDREKSYLNYNLGPKRNITQGSFIRQRCSEVRCQNRKDVNVMCSWIVTIPKDFLADHPDQERDFFQSTYNFLANRYGQENVISAYVHKDEVTPHMHFAFVPIVPDRKRGGYKVSAKECVTRSDLQRFHTDLSHHLEKTFGYKVNVLNDATKDGNKSIRELKQQTVQEARNTVLNAQITADKLNNEVNYLLDQKNALLGQIEALEGKLLSVKEVNSIELKKPLFGEYGQVKMSYKDVLNLKRTAQKVEEITSWGNKILAERDSIIEQAKEKANVILKKAEYDALMISADLNTKRLEVFEMEVKARDQAQKIIEKAEIEAREKTSYKIDREMRLAGLQDELDRINQVKQRYPELGEALDKGCNELIREARARRLQKEKEREKQRRL